MTFKVTEGKGNKKAINVFLKGATAVNKAFKKSLRIVGKQVAADVKSKMTKSPRSGHRYITYLGIGGKLLKRPRTYTASGPGEYPAVITGKLRKSVGFKVLGGTRLEVGADTDYAKQLELGAGRIAPRLYLRHSIDDMKFETQQEITKQVNMSLRRLGFKINR